MSASTSKRRCIYALFHLPCPEKPGACLDIHRHQKALWARGLVPRDVRVGKDAIALLHNLAAAAMKQDKSTSVEGTTEQVSSKRTWDAESGASEDGMDTPTVEDGMPPPKRARLDTDGSDLPLSPAPTPTIDVVSLPPVHSLARPSSPAYSLLPSLAPSDVRARLSVKEDPVAELNGDLANAVAATANLEPFIQELQHQCHTLREQLANTDKCVLACAKLVSFCLEDAFGGAFQLTTVAPDGGLRALLQRPCPLPSSVVLYQLQRCIDTAVRSARQAFNLQVFLAAQPLGISGQAVGGEDREEEAAQGVGQDDGESMEEDEDQEDDESVEHDEEDDESAGDDDEEDESVEDDDEEDAAESVMDVEDR